jgi:hypothetical protein
MFSARTNVRPSEVQGVGISPDGWSSIRPSSRSCPSPTRRSRVDMTSGASVPSAGARADVSSERIRRNLGRLGDKEGRECHGAGSDRNRMGRSLRGARIGRDTRKSTATPKRVRGAVSKSRRTRPGGFTRTRRATRTPWRSAGPTRRPRSFQIERKGVRPIRPDALCYVWRRGMALWHSAMHDDRT